MILLLTSFLAGMLSVLAPCVIAIIPVLITRNATGGRQRSPFFVIGGLTVSIIIFSILLKSTTLLLGVPTMFWAILSGGIIMIFGIVTLFPLLWDKLVIATNLSLFTQKGLSGASSKRGIWADVVLGASLGPVFSACSPTYALIVASILPAEPLEGFLYLLAYVTGLSLLLALIAIFGRSLIQKLGWGINPESMFRRVLGVILIVVGFLIITGFDKDILGFLVSNGLFDWQIDFESNLMSK